MAEKATGPSASPEANDRDRESNRDYSFRAAESVTLDLGEVAELLDELGTTEDGEGNDADGLRANEVSDVDLRQSLRRVLTNSIAEGMNARPDDVFVDILAVFEDSVVYWHRGKTFRRPYSVVDENDGAVEVAGNPEEVRPVTRFVSAEAAADAESAGAGEANDDESKKANESAASDAPKLIERIKGLLGLGDNVSPDLTTGVLNEHTDDVEQRSVIAAVSDGSTSENDNNDNTEIETNEAQEKDPMSQKAKANKSDVKSDEQNLTREQRVAALVAHKHVSYSEQDVNWMTELPDEVFERIENVAMSAADAAEAAIKANESANAGDESDSGSDKVEAKPETKANVEPEGDDEPATPPTAEEYAAAAPPEIRRIFERHLSQEKSYRADLVKTIRANKANKFSEKQLIAMETEQLEAVAALASPEPPEPNYAGMGLHTAPRQAKANTKDDNEPIRMPSMKIQFGSASTAAKERGQ